MALKGQLELENLSADPTSNLSAGQMYFNTTSNVVRVYDGSAWANASSGGGGGGSGSIPTSGLELHLDANDTSSYNGSGSTWYDISGNNRHWNVNQSSFVGTGIKHFDFTGQYRAIYTAGGASLTDMPTYTNRTIIAFSTIVSSSSNYQTLTRGLNVDHQVICWDNGYNLGIATANWYDSGYDITSISNYNTDFNGQFYRLSTSSSPYWAASFNGSTSNQATLTNSAAGSNQGFCVIGQYHNNTTSTTNTSNAQSWGKIHAFLYYSRHITTSEQQDIYDYYKTDLGI